MLRDKVHDVKVSHDPQNRVRGGVDDGQPSHSVADEELGGRPQGVLGAARDQRFLRLGRDGTPLLDRQLNKLAHASKRRSVELPQNGDEICHSDEPCVLAPIRVPQRRSSHIVLDKDRERVADNQLCVEHNDFARLGQRVVHRVRLERVLIRLEPRRVHP
eukprot:Amastigsp_a841164_347.p3 type:complete len:160 gc:universal Amastigsp_a841164_347:461-940(+)